MHNHHRSIVRFQLRLKVTQGLPNKAPMTDITVWGLDEEGFKNIQQNHRNTFRSCSLQGSVIAKSQITLEPNDIRFRK